ncbi:esterase/lipase family protein [Mariniblastus fucicola]|uniref:Alpha/beta hydrolase family protein n=1 Tax=Mariniblastus fucicola TaxID=980251 RepID=A0A5B9P7N4_9BACT|nr:alpha/beta hydrolase [Mariniblastus fucicola]QEG20960.1 Alpha/beta hydrolase family protein [Mariniblastus fucicola]
MNALINSQTQACASTSPMGTSSESEPHIVFIHGIAAPRIVFLYLKWYVARHGFSSRMYGYRSVFKSIPDHADKFTELLQQIDSDPSINQFHIVAHSMGGVVTRQALLKFRPRKLGRFLMLATPNRGSAAARKLSGSIFRFSKTLKQISDEEDSYVRQLEFPDGVEAGAIHADVDRVVTRESSRPAEDVPFCEIASGHNDLLFRKATGDAVVQFLKTGTFA